jgi:hypothetical protein
MIRIRPLFVVLATALLPALVHAAPCPPQYPDYPELIDLGDAIPWPSNLGSETFGRTEPVRFEGQPGQGLMMSWGTKLVYAYAPMTHQAILDSQITASAFTVIRNPDSPAGDVLIVATGSGLSAYVYDLETGSFSGSARTGTSSLANAVLLATGDLDGDSNLDVVGVNSNGTTMRVLYGDGTGAFSSGATITLPSPARDAITLDWDDALSGREIAVSMDGGTRIYTDTGSTLANFASTYATATMAVIKPYGSATEDRLAIVQRNAADTADLLVVVASDGNESAISLGDLDVVGIDAEDYDGDGDDDLAVSHRHSHQLYIYENRSNPGGYSTTFSTDSQWFTAVRIGEVAGASYPVNTADPVLADMDDDGLVDTLVGVNDQTVSSYSTWLFAKARGPRVQGGFGDDEEAVPPFQDFIANVGDDLEGVYEVEYEEDVMVSGNVAVELELVNVWGDLSGGANNLNMEVTVWKQAAGTIETVEDDAIYHVVYAIDAVENEDFLTTVNSTSATLRIGFSVDITLIPLEEDPFAKPFINKFYVQARPVRLVNGVPTSPLRTVIGSITGIDDAIAAVQEPPYPDGYFSIDDMLNNPGAIAPDFGLLADFSAWEDGPSDTGGYAGGLVIQQRIPPTGGLPGVPSHAKSTGQAGQ